MVFWVGWRVPGAGGEDSGLGEIYRGWAAMILGWVGVAGVWWDLFGFGKADSAFRNMFFGFRNG